MPGTPTYEELLESILTDYRNQMPGADTAVGSDIYTRAVALASVLWGAYKHQKWIVDQILPDSAGSEYLERHAGISGLSRKQANKAVGTVTLTGTDGTVVVVGLTLITDDGVELLTTNGGTIDGGTLDVTAEAVNGGIAGNIPAATSLKVQDPIAGIDSSATNGAIFTGGTDEESDAELLTRLLDKIQKPPAGGNANDYKQWALSIDGVDQVFVYPLRLGLGSVSMVILTTGLGSAKIPTQQLLDDVKTYIDTVRPVASPLFQIFAPTAKPEVVTADIKIDTDYTFAQVQPWVTSVLTAYLGSLGPLETLLKSQLYRVIMDIEGVVDCNLTTPAANVTALDLGGTSIEMITDGVVTITESA